MATTQASPSHEATSNEVPNQNEKNLLTQEAKRGKRSHKFEHLKSKARRREKGI